MLNLIRARPPGVCSSGVRQALGASSHHSGSASRRSVRSQRRWQSAAPGANAATSQGFELRRTVARPPADHSRSEKHDDALLRQIFDSPSAWRDFSARSARFPAANAGLFRNAYLTGPDGFHKFAESSLAKARQIVERVLTAKGVEGLKTVVRDLDRLSDLLCRVIDLCDFVRATHPDHRIQKAASEAWSMMYQYMNQLNTTTGLNAQLGRAMADPAVSGSWSEEEAAVAQILKLDFIKSAVNLPQSARDRFVDLSQRISEIGSEFVANMQPEYKRVMLPRNRLEGIDPRILTRFSDGDDINLPPYSAEAASALRSVHDPTIRKQIFLAMRTASRTSVARLESLLRARGELADLAGFESYGHMSLRDRMMAKSPESVKRFLLALLGSNRQLVQTELATLRHEKSLQVSRVKGPVSGGDTTLEPWDKDYYMNTVRQDASRTARLKDLDSLSAYFSVGSVMQGLSRLFGRLFGIRFEPRETLPGEKWHRDVRRLDVVSDTEGHVAVLYCDLFYRGDKSPNPAHFTVRCSREISPAEIAESAHLLQQHQQPGESLSFESPEEAANDGMALSRRSGVVKQLPTIALVCDFPQQPGNGPALLTFAEVETLFHEMGHAIHSVLARTSFQNVSGTRCATDLAELPSTLMEHFAADPAVLALFARHHQTGKALDYELVAERLRQSQFFKGADTENQVILAMLDQAYHSPAAKTRKFNTTKTYHILQRDHGLMPVDPSGTCWQGFFGHLFGYGSAYYSYLFDQVLAERCWKVVFASGHAGAALSRQSGEHLKESLLRWGGSRDPWRCVSDALSEERIARGDEEAMALVGSWGTRSS